MSYGLAIWSPLYPTLPANTDRNSLFLDDIFSNIVTTRSFFHEGICSFPQIDFPHNHHVVVPYFISSPSSVFWSGCDELPRLNPSSRSLALKLWSFSKFRLFSTTAISHVFSALRGHLIFGPLPTVLLSVPFEALFILSQIKLQFSPQTMKQGARLMSENRIHYEPFYTYPKTHFTWQDTFYALGKVARLLLSCVSRHNVILYFRFHQRSWTRIWTF